MPVSVALVAPSLPPVRGVLASGAVLSAIGLGFDLVGALALGLALLRGPKPGPGLRGYTRDPAEAEEDVAYAISGSLLLVGGFTLQSLQHFGVEVNCSTGVTLAAAGGAVAVGVLFVVVTYSQRAAAFRLSRRLRR
jgi:hypothetical protein